MAQPEIASCWADLPDDLLELILRPCSEAAHVQGALSPAKAASLLGSMGPCRRWRAVALDRVSEWSVPPLLAFKRSKLQLPVHPASSLDGQWLPSTQRL